MKGLLLAAVFSTVAVAAVIANSGSFSSFAPSLSGVSVNGPRYTTEDERLVSEIAGSILNIAAFADHFEMGDPFHVRNIGTRGTSGVRFTVARRAEVFTVEVPGHVWRPASYVRLARSFMAEGADSIVSADPYRDRVDMTPLLNGGADVIRVQNVRLSRLLAEHPRSASLHRRAPTLLPAAARREAPADRRELLCRMTAHLAVAGALGETTAAGDAQLVDRLLETLAGGEPPSVGAT